MSKKPSFFNSISKYFGDYLTSMGARGPFGQLLLKATRDAALKKKLVESPETTLAEAGVKLPKGTKVTILENSDKVIHIVLPPLVDADEKKGA
jgi:hypothetical protein